MRAALARASALMALAAALLGGCAHPVRVSAPAAAFWSGRLALQVADKPDQSFSANFELKGSAKAGELSLFSPLGSTLAVLSWTPDSASLRANGKIQQFESLDALASHTTGSPLPVAALFDWLAGVSTVTDGWQADLSQLERGRLQARRNEPPPAADLRIALEQP